MWQKPIQRTVRTYEENNRLESALTKRQLHWFGHVQCLEDSDEMRLHWNPMKEEITGLAVALTCYISHSIKHRKMADFNSPGSQNPKPILMKLGVVDYVWDPTPHDNFAAQRGWSGQICNLSHLASFFFSLRDRVWRDIKPMTWELDICPKAINTEVWKNRLPNVRRPRTKF